MRRVFTRPGDLLVSLPDRSTAFHIEDGHELLLLQVSPALAHHLMTQCGGHSLDQLTPLVARPVRDPLIAEILRRLESENSDTIVAQLWGIGVVFSNLLRRAGTLAAATTQPTLPNATLKALLDRVRNGLTETWTVERMAPKLSCHAAHSLRRSNRHRVCPCTSICCDFVPTTPSPFCSPRAFHSPTWPTNPDSPINPT